MESGYSEKRSFDRMNVDCACRVRIAGQARQAEAIVKNLSGDGLLLWTREPIADGASLEVSIDSRDCVSDCFTALAEVIRSGPAGQAGYTEVACQMVALS